MAQTRNALSAAVDKIFGASLMVLRENAIMPRLVQNDFSREVARQGDAVTIRVPSPKKVEDVNISSSGTDANNTVTADTVVLRLNQWKRSAIELADKEAHEIAERAEGFVETEGGEAVRSVVNQVDQDILGLYTKVGQSAGNSTTAPFTTSTGVALDEATTARRLLEENRAPSVSRCMVLNPEAEEKALQIRALQDASFRNANSPDTLVTGRIGSILGMDWFMDQNVQTHTAGDGLAKQLAAAAIKGATSLTVDGSGTFKAGDLISFGSASTTAFDGTDAYIVAADADSTATTLTITEGLREAQANDVYIINAGSHVANLCFQKGAFAVASRMVTPPEGFTGDQMMRTEVDPVSGLALTLTVYRQEHKTKWEWSILYGVLATRPELAVRVLGQA